MKYQETQAALRLTPMEREFLDMPWSSSRRDMSLALKKFATTEFLGNLKPGSRFDISMACQLASDHPDIWEEYRPTKEVV